MLLESSGFSVLTASSGEQGLQIFSSRPPDAVLLDYYMPGLNGGQVAEEMKRRRPQVPVILLSAYITVPEKTLETVDAFITKGQPPDYLLTKLDSMLRNGHSHPELTDEHVMFVNAQRRYTHVSDAVCHLLGYKRAELLGMSIDDVSLPPPSDVRTLFREYRDQRQQSGSFTLRHKSGRPVPVRYQARVLADGCMVSVLTPVSGSSAAD
jgi:PAS domain S-box-containing protein